VSHKLIDYWRSGTTALSVNLPPINLDSPVDGIRRVAHLHINMPGVLAQVNHTLGDEDINITAQALGTVGNLGYVVTDVSPAPSEDILDKLSDLPGTIRVRILG
jgi:D-3-phosphoglycerate dehydrogenase